MLILLSTFVFSQVKVPESSRKGTIVTQTNEIIEYRNLKFSNGKVFYTNANNNEEEFLYENSVKSIKEIEENSNLEILDKTNVDNISESEQKLISNHDIKEYLLQQNNTQYKSGRTINNIGTALVCGGSASFVIGGISNLSAANKTYRLGEEPKGSPVPLIIGLVGVATGIILKIAGHSQMRNAVNTYKNSDSRKFSPSFYAVNNRAGLGLMMRF